MAGLCLASTRQRVAGPALSALRSRSSTPSGEGQTGRKILVAAQMALALTLLVGSGLMARTFWQLQQGDSGFRPEGGLSFYLPVTHIGLRASYDDFAQLHDRVLRRLRAVPRVDAVEAASASVFPLTAPEGGHDLAAVAPAGADRSGNENWPLSYYGYATPGYFRSMGIPLVAGRPLRSGDTSTGTPGSPATSSQARTRSGGRWSSSISPHGPTSSWSASSLTYLARRCAAGNAAGLAAAVLLTRFSALLLYQTSPTDPVTFAAMASLLFTVALAASYLPARRASRIDPAHALRGE